jgi:predicted glycosyltransferase
MRILINITHPAHVHFFKYARQIWQEHGHLIQVVARDKDITLQLLREYNIPYQLGSLQQKSMPKLALELLAHSMRIVSVSQRFKPDVLVSVASTFAAWASFVLQKPHIAFDDTEHAMLEHLLYTPFTQVIYTPDCFIKDLGKKQRRYPGYHELAYLHPARFTPNAEILKQLCISQTERFFIVRFTSWEAIHDRGYHGLSLEGKQNLIHQLGTYGKVLITSEKPLPSEFESYRIKAPPTQIHHLLAFSSLYIGEGATMATEAALLGTPSIYIGSFNMGNMNELSQRYGLMAQVENEQDAIYQAMRFVSEHNLRAEQQKKRQRLLAEKIDVTRFLVEEVERIGLDTI